MAYILNIETSTTNCSVSLSKNGETLVLKEDYNSNYSHAERLHLFIDQAIKEAKISKTDLDAIAISKGPGSYTGLRIGVSTAKGLCYALDIPPREPPGGRRSDGRRHPGRARHRARGLVRQQRDLHR